MEEKEEQKRKKRTLEHSKRAKWGVQEEGLRKEKEGEELQEQQDEGQKEEVELTKEKNKEETGREEERKMWVEKSGKPKKEKEEGACQQQRQGTTEHEEEKEEEEKEKKGKETDKVFQMAIEPCHILQRSWGVQRQLSQEKEAELAKQKAKGGHEEEETA